MSARAMVLSLSSFFAGIALALACGVDPAIAIGDYYSGGGESSSTGVQHGGSGGECCEVPSRMSVVPASENPTQQVRFVRNVDTAGGQWEAVVEGPLFVRYVDANVPASALGAGDCRGTIADGPGTSVYRFVNATQVATNNVHFYVPPGESLCVNTPGTYSIHGYRPY